MTTTTTMKHATFVLHTHINMRSKKNAKEIAELNKQIAKIGKAAVPYFEGSFQEFKKHYGI